MWLHQIISTNLAYLGGLTKFMLLHGSELSQLVLKLVLHINLSFLIGRCCESIGSTRFRASYSYILDSTSESPFYQQISNKILLDFLLH
jgi:hypothetical protein